jgi:hypothetical protein
MSQKFVHMNCHLDRTLSEVGGEVKKFVISAGATSAWNWIDEA